MPRDEVSGDGKAQPLRPFGPPPLLGEARKIIARPAAPVKFAATVVAFCTKESEKEGEHCEIDFTKLRQKKHKPIFVQIKLHKNHLLYLVIVL